VRVTYLTDRRSDLGSPERCSNPAPMLQYLAARQDLRFYGLDREKEGKSERVRLSK
jgi:hypothetical protein